MNKKELVKSRNKIYSGSPSIFWVMSVFCVLVLLGTIALELVIPAGTIISFPLLFCPIFFACYAILYTIKFGGTVTVGSTFKIGFTYFKNPNFGCFRLIRNLFKAVLVYLIASAVLSIVCRYIFTNIYGADFTNSYDELMSFSTSLDMEAFVNFLSQESLAIDYINMYGSLANSCGIFAFVFGIIYSSISLYTRINLQQAPAPAVNGLVNEFLKSYRKEYRRDFWYLNWPIFLLLLVGFAAGYLIIILGKFDYNYLIIITSLTGIIFMLPYVPFMFANMEALFDKYGPEFKKTGERMAEEALDNLKQRDDLSEEDKKRIEEIIAERNKKDSNDNEES